MGGMGTIHEANDFIIYSENHTMTLNLLAASVAAGVKKFFYASSACIYPGSLQSTDSVDVSLRETDVWTSTPPSPQGLYGLEKLVSELLLQQYKPALDVRIARFHNVYGPGGAWNNGREKAPAAMCRKALAIKLIRSPALCENFEIWGDGRQRRSFLYIEDCVEAIVRLLQSDCTEPVNIGSDYSVRIKDLASLALRFAGIAGVEFQFDRDKPVGVISRNSNNDFVREKLGWTPTTSLEEGIRKTGDWIEGEMRMLFETVDDPDRNSVLQSLQNSQLVDLGSESVTFAILLPITSRGANSPADCLANLTDFGRSLDRTTWRDTHRLGGTCFRLKVYLAIDCDDKYLLESDHDNKAAPILRESGIVDIATLPCDYPRGHICSLWRHCARRAWDDKCDYFVLMGEDVILQDEGWMRDAHTSFLEMAREQRVPPGFGCVAFTDTSFPGMPTFPIIHRTHMDIFCGEVVPEVFINQDGDPYLFQLYLRWGCSRMFDSRIHNRLGGSEAARYTKQHARDWTYDTLNSSSAFLESWLRDNRHPAQRKLTLDIIIPCYRVQLAFLGPILQLRSSESCAVMFIVIVDDPTSPHIAELEKQYSHRSDVRIRVNAENLGASASRNRGLMESAAEWVHFLDDDVYPQPDLLIEAEKIIRAHPESAGFIGNVRFPSADNVFTAALHLAGVIYFWDIATKIATDVPWGVTANLIAKRNKDGVFYDVDFPKTGGGEDIDFCRKKREISLKEGNEAFRAAPNVIVTHPWWFGGKRVYRRFYMWAVGDGGLVKKYPEHRYQDAAPNSAELLLLCASLFLAGGACALVNNDWNISILSLKATLAVFIANIAHDFYRHLWRDVDRTTTINTTVRGIWWTLAIVDSSMLRMVSEAGRAIGMIRRGQIVLLGQRFDWFTGRAGNKPIEEERKNSLQRMALVVALVALLYYYT